MNLKSFLLLIWCSSLCLGFTAFAAVPLQKLEMINPKQPSETLLTGGQPSQADYQKLAATGVKTIINLRTKGEFNQFDQSGAAKALGMDYVEFPISGRTGINKENAVKLDQLLSRTQGKVLLHCGSGNRVGALMALRAFYVQGKPIEESLAIGKAAGMTRLSKKVEKIISR